MTSLTVQLPDWLAKELSDAGQEFIAEMLKLGLRTRKIEQALAQYARGQMTHGAAAGIAGSARIGRHCTAGGGAIILGHLELVDHVHVTAHTVVTRSILRPGQYSGLFPFDDNASWEKNAATLRQLHTLRERLRALEKKIG